LGELGESGAESHREPASLSRLFHVFTCVDMKETPFGSANFYSNTSIPGYLATPNSPAMEVEKGSRAAALIALTL
jgi:hypothetical protein